LPANSRSSINVFRNSDSKKLIKVRKLSSMAMVSNMAALAGRLTKGGKTRIKIHHWQRALILMALVDLKFFGTVPARATDHVLFLIDLLGDHQPVINT
jgi:hypothetical protein